MARQFWMHLAQSKIALVTATTKTIASLTTPSTGCRIAIQAITMSFDGTSNTAQPVECHLQRITTDGTGTTQNPVKKDSDIASGILTTAKVNYTIEPTTYTANAILASLLIHPQAGVQYPFPLPGEIIIPANAIVGLWVNAPASVNCLFMMEGEE
jgi:hypothetical protein